MRHLKKFEEVTGDDLMRQHNNDFPVSLNDWMGKEEKNELCPECNCKPVDGKCECECEEENDVETTYGDENIEEVQTIENKLYTFSTFNEKKEMSDKQKAIFGKKSDKEDVKKDDDSDDKADKKAPAKKAPAKKSDAKGKVPETEAEKKLAAKYGDKKRITKGDFIKAAIDNKKKKVSKEK